MRAACVIVAFEKPRVRDTARCCVWKLVVANTLSIVPGLGRGDGWCFEARNKKVASSIVGQLTEQEIEALINGGSLPDTISIQAEIDKYMTLPAPPAETAPVEPATTSMAPVEVGPMMLSVCRHRLQRCCRHRPRR